MNEFIACFSLLKPGWLNRPMNGTLLLLLFSLIFGESMAFTQQDSYRLNTQHASLQIKKGRLTITGSKGYDISLSTPLQGLWKLTLGNKMGRKTVTPTSEPDIKQKENALVLVYKDLKAESTELPLIAEMTVTTGDDAFIFSGHVRCTTGGCSVRHLKYPILSGIQLDTDCPAIYLPEGLGARYTDLEHFHQKSPHHP